MNIFDLTKATIVCGLVAFVFYSYPIISQVLLIGVLGLVWLSYAYRTMATIRRKKIASAGGHFLPV